jgi:hypothetical protein
MAPSTAQPKRDILMSIKEPHIASIVSRIKTHEFRKYELPASFKRIWFYISSPIQRLSYVAVIGSVKKPGEISMEDEGIGNEEFNNGLKESKFGYEVLHLWELSSPRLGLSLEELKQQGFVKGPPQKY